MEIEAIETHNPSQKTEHAVNLLWTGGWDSTFRLMQLLTKTQCIVQPHYLIATRRPSAIREIITIGKLRDRIHVRHPEHAHRILPTHFYSIHEIPKDPEIYAKYNALKKTIAIGTQYETLARLAKWAKLDHLELSIQRLQSQNRISSYLAERSKAMSGPGGLRTYALDNPRPETPEAIFASFHYPLLDFTKRDMALEAEREGFLDVLYSTWFCHDPINGKPCGLCSPCGFVAQEGLWERLPVAARLRYRFRSVFYLLPRNRARRF